METEQTNFDKVLDQSIRRAEKVVRILKTTRQLREEKRIEPVYETASDGVYESERLTLLMRVLPAYTGHPGARAKIEEILRETVPVSIGYTQEGWFAAFIPALLPKKSKGNANYYREILYPAMSRFYTGKVPVRYPNCVLVFRHVYDRTRPERQYRDHDNIEVNAVADIIAFYTMKDDHPLRCKHHYCSAAGSEDRTEVYVVPQSEFIDWYTAEKAFPDEGVELLENRP